MAKEDKKPKEEKLTKEDAAKARSLSDAIAQIEKMYGKGSIMTLGKCEHMEVEVVPTGLLTLDAALGAGGLPKGRVIEIYGHESSGKTTLALTVIASCQKLGGTAAFIDAEHALDPKYAKQLGVDIDSMLLSQPDNGEQALEIADTLTRSGAVDIIVIDSVAALVPKAEIDGDMDSASIGLQARLMSKALRKLTGSISKTNCIVVFINQIRAKISTGYSQGPSETTTGGNALKFYASVRVEVKKIKTLYSKEEAVGSITQFKIVKNKVAPPFKKVELEIMYGQGISREGEILDLAEKMDIFQRSGAYYYYNNEKLAQGKEKLREMLKTDKKLADELEAKIRAKFGTVDITEEAEVSSEDIADSKANPEDDDML
ncbi:recombinase RecA [Candidatus Deianiraea vastatrix]|nr:recombinase RecA [Candidatus Deianiraea vastatrix]